MNFNLKDPRTNWKFVAIVVVLGLAVGGLIVWYTNSIPRGLPSINSSKSTPIPQPQIDTSSWQTYRSDEFGFEVRYPSSLELEQEADRITLRHEVQYSNAHPCSAIEQFEALEMLEDFRMSIEVLPKDYGDAFRDGDLPEPFSGWEDPSSDELAVSIGPLNGYGFWLGNHGCGSWIYVFPVSPERTFVVRRLTLPASDSFYLDKGEEIFEQILSTFRFVP
ncbi:MAG: hypothetical protein AAB524_00865 [Patescibacteria group bacterium]